MPIHLVIKKREKKILTSAIFMPYTSGTFVCVVLFKHLVESCETTGSKLRGLVCRQKVCRLPFHVGRVELEPSGDIFGLGDPHSRRTIYSLVWETIIESFFLVGQPVSYHFKMYICIYVYMYMCVYRFSTCAHKLHALFRPPVANKFRVWPN